MDLHQQGLTVSSSPYKTSAAHLLLLPKASHASFHCCTEVRFCVVAIPYEILFAQAVFLMGGRTFLSNGPLKSTFPITRRHSCIDRKHKQRPIFKVLGEIFKNNSESFCPCVKYNIPKRTLLSVILFYRFFFS